MKQSSNKFNPKIVWKGWYDYGIILLLQWGTLFSGYSQQDLSFRQLSVNEGLSQNSAVSITQDQDGFLWIATQEGLNRYDGKNFKVYKKKFVDITRLTHLQLGKVFADSKNRIWIIPNTSIPETLDPATDKFYPVPGITEASCFTEDFHGNIWAGSFGGQLCLYNDSLQEFEQVWHDPDKEIKDLEIVDDKHLLLTFKNGLALWNTEKNSLTHFELPPDDVFYSCSKVDVDGNIWVGSLTNGVMLVPEGKQKAFPASDFFDAPFSKLQNTMVLDIASDSNGNIWIATYGNGAYLFDPEKLLLKNYNYSKQNPRSIHYNDILCIFEDYTGTLWFGTDGGGLSYYDAFLEKFNYFHNQQVPEDVNIDVVRSLFVDENEHVWVGTSGKGLTEYNPVQKEWETHKAETNHSLAPASNRIMSLWGDGKGKLWVGYQGEGLSILDLNTRTSQHFTTESEIPLPASTVWKIFEDSQNRVWLATRSSGLIWFDPGKGVVEQYTHDPDDPHSLPGNNIRTIEKGNENELWIGAETRGIAKFDMQTGRFSSLKHNPDDPKSISSNNIKSLYYDEDNYLWIGTNGEGLNALNLETRKVTRITTADGLANDVIYGILPGNRGSIWLSSNMGITRLDYDNPDSLLFTITNFTNYEGLASEFNTGAYYKHHDGTLYFGSLEGFYWFRPEDISFNEIAPKTAITEFLVYNKPMNLNSPIVLSHNENTITLHLASLAFSSPQKNEFTYKLVGHDDNWVEVGNNHRARYTNLDPGEYTFLAKSSNYDGIWSDTPVSLTFTILPPWYQTLWARVLYILVIVALLFGFYQYMKWRWFMQVKLRLKENEAARLQEINEFKSTFFTHISHEFRTPLTLISGPAERLLSQSENPVFKSQLHLIRQNANRLVNLVDQLMEVSKIKSGKHQLNVEQGNVSLLIQTIVVNYYHLAIEKNMRIRTDISGITEVWFDPDKLEKIVGNLIHNAIKYGRPDADILIQSRLTDGSLLFVVENESVIEYDPEDMEKLSQKFFQKNRKSEGYGIGISLVNDLVQICHGHLNIDLTEEKIFRVEVNIPVTKEAYTSGELREDEKSADEEHISGPRRSRRVTQNSPLILVVEDNEELRNFIVEGLQTHYRILQANDGKEGLKLALRKIPDLVISDVMMPELDGIEFCKTLKSDEKTSHIPVILLTAKSDEESTLKGLKAGADDYFIKPVSSVKLHLRVEKLIELRERLRNIYNSKFHVSPGELALTSMDEKFLEKVQKLIDNEMFDMKFSADDFAKRIGMSRMQLHRKLTALTGLSANAFIRDQRLKMAIQKLKSKSGSVSEIAYSVGFSSPSYFIKCFRENYQMTPAEYMNNHRN
jgi:ligand-binding sensor domain-containing protein/signal transduction histidine kinase/AraC-like DNA-binding protein